MCKFRFLEFINIEFDAKKTYKSVNSVKSKVVNCNWQPLTAAILKMTAILSAFFFISSGQWAFISKLAIVSVDAKFHACFTKCMIFSLICPAISVFASFRKHTNVIYCNFSRQ